MKLDLKLEPSNSKILRQQMPHYDGNPRDLKDIADQMIEAMVRFGGIGLAAPQVGLLLNMFVMGHRHGYLACINPVIMADTYPVENLVRVERCLSFPNRSYTISRPSRVTVMFTTPEGEEIITTLEGIMARCFLHEYDHLQGITFDTKASHD